MNTTISKNFYDISKIPKDWSETKLKYILSISENKSSNFNDEKILSLTKKGIVVKDITNNTGQIAESYEKYILVKKGQICMNPMDLLSGWVDISSFDGLISPAYYTFNLNEEFENKFINYFLQSNYLRKTFFKLGKGVASHDNFGRWVLTPEELKNVFIFFPNIEKQKIISSYLDNRTNLINLLIEKTQKKIKLLKEQQISLINQCVTKGLDQNAEMKDSGIDWIGKIPKNWNTIPNKYIFLEYFGGSWGDDPKDDQKENLVRVIRVTEFNMKTLCILSDIPTIRSLKLEKNSKKYIKKNDLVLEKSGGGEKTPVGRVVLVDKDLPHPTINSNFTNICRPNTNIVYPRFVVYSFWSKYKNGQTLRNIKQTTGIQNLDLSGFMSEIFILPEIEEQIKISNYLDNKIFKINNMIKKLDSKISLLKEYRKSLISSVVTGVIRVTEDLI
jgi:type I restriction enzyme, S subunit